MPEKKGRKKKVKEEIKSRSGKNAKVSGIQKKKKLKVKMDAVWMEEK